MMDNLPNDTLTPHPSADVFPVMDAEQFQGLLADIKQNGLREPIIVDLQNRIVDGFHRYRACIKADIKPKIERRSLTNDEARDLSISRNLHRRHLSTSQRAAIAAGLATAKQGGSQPANLPGCLSQAKAASLLGISERAVRSAVKVQGRSPDLHQQVKAGRLSVHLAEQASDLSNEVQRDVVEKIKNGDANGAKAKVKAALTTSQLKKLATSKARCPAAYAPIFAELYALPDYLKQHPMPAEHAADLIAECRQAIERIEQAVKSVPEADHTRELPT